MSLAAPLRLPHNSLIIAQAMHTPSGISASDPVATAAAASSTIAARDETSLPAEGHSDTESSKVARSLPLAAAQLSRSGLNPQASAYPCSRPSLDAAAMTSSAPVTPPSTPTPSNASTRGGEDPDDVFHSPSRAAEKEDFPGPEDSPEDGILMGNSSLDFKKLGLVANVMSNDGTTEEEQDEEPATATSQPVAFQVCPWSARSHAQLHYCMLRDEPETPRRRRVVVGARRNFAVRVFFLPTCPYRP